MKKIALVAVAAVVVAGGLLAAPASAGTKIDVCHLDSSSKWNLIRVSDSAWDAHAAHGDGIVNGAVPGMTDYVFSSTCVPTYVPPPPPPPPSGGDAGGGDAPPPSGPPGGLII